MNLNMQKYLKFEKYIRNLSKWQVKSSNAQFFQKWFSFTLEGTVLRIRDVYPGSRNRDFESQIWIRIKEFKYFLTQKIVFKLSEIWSGMFIADPDPYLEFLPIPDPGSRSQKGTGFRIPDPQHSEGNLSVSPWTKER